MAASCGNLTKSTEIPRVEKGKGEASRATEERACGGATTGLSGILLGRMSAAFQHVSHVALLLLFQVADARPAPHQQTPGGLQLLHQPLPIEIEVETNCVSFPPSEKKQNTAIHQGVIGHPSRLAGAEKEKKMAGPR